MEPQAPSDIPHHQNLTSSPAHSDGSVLSDSDATNYSSANSTLRSDLSGGKHGRTSHKDAIATLNFFLSDVSEMTEKAKQEEEIRLQSAKESPPPSQESAKPEQRANPATIPSPLSKKWISMPSVVSDDGFGELYCRQEKSLEDVRSIEYDVFSDEEQELSAHEKKRRVHLRNQTNKANISMSSQGSDATSPQTYGLTHLNHLCKFLEQFEQLQQQNSELSKRVSKLEFDTKKTTSGPETIPAKSSGNDTTSQRNSDFFAVPKDKPKKAKNVKTKAQNNKLKGRTKYLATLPFLLAAKSVDNLKQNSSHMSEKPKSKVARPKKSYAADDIEVGKTLHITEEWRNSSVKSPSGKYPEKRFSAFEPNTDKTEEMIRSSEQEVKEEIITPVVVVSEEATTSNIVGDTMPPSTKIEERPANIQEQPPVEVPAPPPRSKSEERNYRNTKKMTEWGTLQQAFPVPQIESNLDLLNHLESITSVNKPSTKKGSTHGFKLPGKNKKEKTSSSNMYLPSTDIPGFTSTFLASHAMTNQLTLTLNLNDLDLLSTTDSDPNTPSLTDHGVSIS